jgi:site-specific DNA recombinase
LDYPMQRGTHTMQIAGQSESAVIYVRVSSERQLGNASLETQENACRAYCEKNDWPVLAVFREQGESAKTADRTQLQAALQFCRQNKQRPKYFVVNSVDRLARNAYDHSNIKRLLLLLGVLLRSPTQRLGESPNEKLMETMLAGFAEFDNDLRAEKTVAGMKTRLSQGQWTWRAPIGYLNFQDAAGRKSLIPDPDRARWIQQAFELYATGLHTKQAVLQKITALGLRSKKGRKLSQEDFRRMLRNPIYVGLLSIEGWGIEMKASFEPLVPHDLFESVQALLDGKKRSVTPRTRNHMDFPLRHFAKCGNCAKPLTASWSRSHTGKKYPYYRCQNRNCGFRVNESKQVIETAFQDYLRQLQPKPEYVKLFKSIVLDVWQDKQRRASEERAIFDKQVNDCKERKKKLFQAYSGGAISIDEYKEMKGELDEELTLTEIRANEARLEEGNLDGLLDFAESILLDPASFWLHCSSGQKQQLQKALFPEGVEFANGVYRTHVTCLMFDLLQPIEAEKEELVALTGIEPVF